MIRTATRTVCALSVFAAGCAAQPLSPHVGVDAGRGELPPEPIETKKAEPPPPPPDDVVEKSALPFFGERAADGKKLEAAAFFTELARADAICVGERHDQPSDHFAELSILKALEERREIGGFALGVGFEMFEADYAQSALDSYAAGRSELEKLVSNSGYAERWGFPIQYYAPLLSTARDSKNTLLALNTTQFLARKVAENGAAGLSPELEGRLPEMDFDSARHRALFDGMMAGHPPTGASAENMYEAQVLWDEAMAERAAAWLVSHSPARKLVIFAGQAHCYDAAIPERMRRRGVGRVVSVMPLVEGELPAATAADETPSARASAPPGDTEATLRAGYDYRFVMMRK